MLYCQQLAHNGSRWRYLYTFEKSDRYNWLNLGYQRENIIWKNGAHVGERSAPKWHVA